MTIDNAQLDRIVTLVVERLAALRDAASLAGGGPRTASSPETTAAPGEPAALAVSDRVVTLETLRQRLHGARRVIVGPRAIVTPAARDELKQRGVHWERAGAELAPPASATASAAPALATPAAVRLLAAVAVDGFPADGLWRALGGVEVLPGGELVAATRRLAWSVRQRGLPGLLVTDAPAAAAALANRQRRVRAATARDPAEAADARRQFGANVLAVSPRLGWPALRRVTETWLATPAGASPAGLAAALDSEEA